MKFKPVLLKHQLYTVKLKMLRLYVLGHLLTQRLLHQQGAMQKNNNCSIILNVFMGKGLKVCCKNDE